MARTIMVGEVRTGRRITQIPVASASWSMAHRGPGEITVDIPLGAAQFAELEREVLGQFPGPGIWPSLETWPLDSFSVWTPGDGLRPEFLAALEPGRCFLAVLEGDTVLEAGPIWSWDYTLGGSLRVSAAGLWSLLDHRFVIGDLASAWAEWAQTYTSLSLGTIAKRIVQLAEATSGGDLPIVLPADEAGVHERVFNGFDLGTVRQRLEQLMGVEGGPDIAFEPRLTTDRMGIEWVLRTGTNADPLLHQSMVHVWDSRVPRGGVSGLSVKRDASGLAQRSYVTGSGMETALLMARASDTSLLSAGYPLMEVKDARSTVEDQATLNRWAEGNLSKASRPWQVWTCTVRADENPALGTYRPGDFCKVWVSKDHPLLSHMLPEGFHQARVLNVQGDLSNDVQLTLMPAKESR